MIADIVEKRWDVIVIGTGMGGGMVGRRLAERGLQVLFLDRGPGVGGEAASACDGAPGGPAARSDPSYWPEAIEATIDGRRSSRFGLLGSGVGGTSVHYAASLERPERHDLDDSAERPHPTGGWPVGYDAFQPYFDAATRLFDVCGEADPLSAEPQTRLRPPPPLSPGDAALMRSFRRGGLHPYRAPVGIRYLPGCTECIGHVCLRSCKLDARTAGVEPGLATGNAVLLDECEVTALRGDRTRVTHVDARRGGERLTLSARCVVLSAGGLASPRLLLASASEAWPQGCANATGLVGRNLMFHLSERIAIWPDRRMAFGKPAKTISLRDFYFRDGKRLGLFQSMGHDATYGSVLLHFYDKFDRSAFRSLRPLRGALRIPALAAARYFGSARIFVGILEDLPVPSNRVVFDARRPDTLAFEYTLTSELHARRVLFRAMIGGAMPKGHAFFLHREPELNLAHPCGTLRFGVDPARSVLDPSCRAHALENLYAVDSAFMPTSNGVNPSLTIAANALRVADAIVLEFPSTVRGAHRAEPAHS